MNRKDILDFIFKYKDHKFYQPVIFEPDILEIRGKWHNATLEFADQLFSENKIQSLLDVGCNVGFFLHEGKRAGISKVVGYEIDPYVLNITSDINQIFQDGVILKDTDLTKHVSNEEFDLILLLNLAIPTEQLCQIIKNVKSKKFILEIPNEPNVKELFFQYGVQLSNVMPSQRIVGRAIRAEIYS